MKICPFMSTAIDKVACDENCALFSQNKNCVIVNLEKMQSDLDYVAESCENFQREK